MPVDSVKLLTRTTEITQKHNGSYSGVRLKLLRSTTEVTQEHDGSYSGA